MNAMDKKIEKEIKNDSLRYVDLSEKYKNSIGIVMTCLYDLQDIFPILSEELRCNKKIALLAIKNESDNFKYIPDELKKDQNFILKVLYEIQNIRYLFSYLPEEMLTNKKIILELVKIDKGVYKLLSDD